MSKGAYIDIPGVRLWYTDTGGHGPPVILLHPQTGTCEIWELQTDAFAQAGYRCISYDRRGWGRSVPTGDGDQPGFSGDDLRALIMHLKLGPVHLIGSASGAIVGLDYVLRFGADVRSYVFDNSYGGLQEPAMREMLLERIYPRNFDNLPWYLKSLSPSYRATNPEGVLRWREISEARSDKEHPRQPPRALLTMDALHQLATPVLAIAGEASLASPPALVRMIAGAITGSSFIMIPEAGQAAFWEQAELWNDHVLRFLDQH